MPESSPQYLGDRTSVFVLDDHRVFTDLLSLTLGMQPDLRCVGVAHTLDDAFRLAAITEFDVAIVDRRLPDGDGLTFLPWLRTVRPDVRTVVLTAHPRAEAAEQAFAEGAAAFLPKDGSLSEILDAVRGGAPACVHPHLTAREKQVLDALALGLDAHRIAAELGISLHTTRDHIKVLLGKLDAHTQLEAVVVAHRLGVVALSGPR
ncbi:response regulator transcription factor [Pseudonocardia sp.]|jgi:DNA-binding NarL/FixJ family response regulator|uniref:response regulator transcription factor n=1 Tax=Pseudonocardia sp. TaxID=60912 RepID=UPI003D147FF8